MNKENKLVYSQAPYKHVVLLGAGASKAACLNGDKNGVEIPLMNDMPKVITPLADVLIEHGYFPDAIDNFEDFYDKLSSNSGNLELQSRIEMVIWDFFNELELPDEINLYDLLLLSLTKNDLIATFNWDPFLAQAYKRALRIGKIKNLPQICFLHGNVEFYTCREHKNSGFNDHVCNVCNHKLKPSSLLYPVGNKDYKSDTAIRSQWSLFSRTVADASILTIFGYSAPTTDLAAKNVLLESWKKLGEKHTGLVEVIDIQPRGQIEKKWQEFYFEDYNFAYFNRLEDSYLFQYIRQSGYALYMARMQQDPIQETKFPKVNSLKDLYQVIKDYDEFS